MREAGVGVVWAAMVLVAGCGSKSPNAAPLAAVIGPDGQVTAGAEVVLDGSDSSDPDGDALTYEWVLTALPEGSTATLAGPATSATILRTDLSGEYRVSLVVSDGTAASEPLAVTVHAKENRRPLAVAGPNREATAGDVVRLDGSGSQDPDGEPISYVWFLSRVPEGSTASLSGAFTAQAELRTDLIGDYEVVLVISDGRLLSAPDPVLIQARREGYGENTPPIARLVGPTDPVELGRWVYFHARESSDPDGDELTYSVSFDRKPAASEVRLTDGGYYEWGFRPDEPGIYVVRLTVHDGMVASGTTLEIQAVPVNVEPVAVLDPIIRGKPGAPVILDASASHDGNGDPLTFTWNLSSLPTGSDAELAADGGPTASFVPDLEGDYRVAVRVSDGRLGRDAFATVTVSSGDILEYLPFAHAEADYSDARDVLVMTSTDPAALHVYNPVARTLDSVALPRPPSGLSVSPSGTHAVVGHDGWISYVDLTGPTLVDTYAVPTDVFDLVLTDGGFVYAFPMGSTNGIVALDLATGTAADPGYPARSRMRVQLSADGTRIVAAPYSGMEVYSVDGFSLTRVASSTFSQSACNNLWLSEDDSRVFTACGTVYDVTDPATSGFVYTGSLEGAGFTRVLQLDHSASARRVAAIYEQSGLDEADAWLQLLDDRYLAREVRAQLPKVAVDGVLRPTYGRFVLFGSEGDVWVIGTASAGIGLPWHQLLIRFPG